MSEQVPTFCEEFGCTDVALGGRFCDAHKRTDRDRGRPSSRERYGRHWPKLRKMVLARDPLCCVSGCFSPANEVDHVVRKTHGGADTLDNLQGLCRMHHEQKTVAERKDDREQGKRLVVAGPIGSGKSTWVRRNAPSGALVWDLDEFGALLFNRDTHAGDTDELDILLEVRRVIVSHLNRVPCGRPCFIIVSKLEQAARVAAEIRGEVVAVTSPMEDIVERIGQRVTDKKEVDELILAAREWFVRAHEFEAARRRAKTSPDSTRISEVSGVIG